VVWQRYNCVIFSGRTIGKYCPLYIFVDVAVNQHLISTVTSPPRLIIYEELLLMDEPDRDATIGRIVAMLPSFSSEYLRGVEFGLKKELLLFPEEHPGLGESLSGDPADLRRRRRESRVQTPNLRLETSQQPAVPSA
jgi:hypothetical protein